AVWARLPGVSVLPEALAPWRLEQACQLGTVEHVGQRFALLGRAQDVCRVALEVLALDAEGKEAAQRRDRPCLACWRRAMRRLLGQEASELRRVNLGQRADPSRVQEVKAGAHVTLICLARQV